MSSDLAPAAVAEPQVAEAAAVPEPWLVDALEVADGCASVREAAAALRDTFAPLRVVVVDAMDMRGEAPAAASARHRLYLGASDGHCWRVTADAREAAGLFLCTAA
jgi:hypothetical protein